MDKTLGSQVSLGFNPAFATPCVCVCVCVRACARTHVCLCVCCVLVTQTCPSLCDPIDCSLPGFSVHGILQARIQE